MKHHSILLVVAVCGGLLLGLNSCKPSTGESIAELKKEAEDGDAVSMYNLALKYEKGEGVEKDLEKAAELTRQAAEKGLPEAQYLAGWNCYKGTGTEINLREATNWARKGAEQGRVNSMNLVARVLIEKDSPVKDFREAELWVAKAGEAVDPNVLLSLSWAYFQGAGVEKNEETAIKWLRRGAEKGHGECQRLLGVSYLNGEAGLPKNPTMGIEWLRKSAAQGEPRAQYHLANLFHEGTIVKKDPAEAEKWGRAALVSLEKIVDQEPKAFQILGLLYSGYHALPAEPKKAIEWYEKAAGSGDAKSQSILGGYLTYGPEEVRDVPGGIKWFQKAADGGEAEGAEAAYQLFNIYYDGVSPSLEPQSAKAMGWLRKSAELGHLPAQQVLGSALLRGDDDLAKDPVEGVKWLRKAAEGGDTAAQLDLGIALGEGKDVAKDPAESARWYRKAADAGNTVAQNNLAVLYKNGTGVEKNAEQAANWYRRAAEGGEPFAQCNLGELYATGDGVKKDVPEALKWYRKSAEQGHARAAHFLGEMYTQGIGVVKSETEGFAWFKRAAESADDGYHQFYLGALYEKGQFTEQNDIEAMAWYYLAKAAGYPEDQPNFLATQEQRVGRTKALAGQKRSQELLTELQAKQEARAAEKQKETEVPATKSPKVKAAALETKVTAEAPQPAPAGAASPSPDPESSFPTSRPKFSGSGIVVSADGYVLTASHVVEQSKKFVVHTSEGKRTAKLVKIDPVNDVAILKCEGKFSPAVIGASKGVRLGQGVFTLGFPNVNLQGFSPKLTRGEISSLNGFQDDPRHWQISVPVQSGNSGGALFDAQGHLVGIILLKLDAINVATTTGDLPQNVSYALKMGYAQPLLDNFLKDDASPTKKPGATEERLEDVVDRVQGSVVLVLGY